MSASDSTSMSQETENVIEQKRKQVLEETGGNKAQEDLLDLLDQLDPSATVIDNPRRFEGDLDFSILEKCNFKGITSIVLIPGMITSITGIPSGIKTFVCPSNYLVDMPDLPDSIVEVDFQRNALKTIGPLPAGLKELNISNNHIETLENLPASLEVLRCNDNNLRVLNLTGIENLRVLHCSNNPRLVVEGLPDTLVDFQMDNDVATQIQRDPVEGEPDIESKANYSECLYTYFELKKRYDDGVLKKKRDAYSSAKSKKAARVKIADLKPKCIECARPVGTIFKREDHKYIARCGDSKEPCSLDIQLFSGEYSEITEMLAYYKRLIEAIKEKIMVDKLNVLFNYVSEVEGVEVFKMNLDFYTEENMHLITLQKECDDLYFSEERKEKVDIKLKKIQDIQERIGELFSKGTPEVIEDAMTVYIEELMPEMENLQFIKYDTRELLVDDKKAELYQIPWRIQQLEYTFGEYPRVIKFRAKSAN
jgi:hypothetical protein